MATAMRTHFIVRVGSRKGVKFLGKIFLFDRGDGLCEGMKTGGEALLFILVGSYCFESSIGSARQSFDRTPGQ